MFYTKIVIEEITKCIEFSTEYNSLLSDLLYILIKYSYSATNLKFLHKPFNNMVTLF
uniref:Uncharacterized protein n=1 Tax=Heterorhabditis bacteriophora TaxID=37862 RepID=A0A1I7W7U1_HETBA